MKADWFTKSALAVIAVSLLMMTFGWSSGQSSAVAADPAADVGSHLQDVVISSTTGSGEPSFIAFDRRTGNFAWYKMDIPGNRARWIQWGPMGHIDSIGTDATTTQHK